eukprot:7109246-Prymnesium_polylepis.1
MAGRSGRRGRRGRRRTRKCNWLVKLITSHQPIARSLQPAASLCARPARLLSSLNQQVPSPPGLAR